MKRIICFVIGHNWGRQENVRRDDRPVSSIGAFLFGPGLLLAALFSRICERTCKRCGKTKTDSYDSHYGT